ncbi:D-alanyl-D-alanine carboxypeptidase family protein [Paenibacillus mucilaginosus]|uniref:serine-type D-Ala-D-Ala carboxypeptidase n=2 Tax=Paenibacillus mucilaginosus TaxID=61624 RepID=H6NMG0_9BACL|nr:D-alanyl-D-alanine carboxypeptidase family protein [Paenibacillus mucilaginosus]AEI41274.1 DacF [Paenibacillus mucilaginosus KNP414]AFC29826.1 DacF [Paenibacillus mucilaginosus 3016]MCG7211304.1 D-alanyl-D-alanine carboxypeptidase [Paenibacillus mucilaginosus]WDM30306.1 D-alanyl-D-alanine carboxypeptidase [Paenibacillus mucilaginosus]WFA18491.1 D-alanyl-D-alanine carboxypeptidase [Paenibacillus mucilaginosus]
MISKVLKWFVSAQLLLMLALPAALAEEGKGAAQVDLAPNATSAVIIDADTGTVIFEKNKDAKLPPASITKIMTMLLTMEALDAGKLKMDDKVPTSEYAASMGGSQIFLEPGEEMTVQDMLKGIAMASGNDASVAMAEKIAGSEEAFVRMMNERAEQLGMKNTKFVNPNGLPAEGHVSSAYDIALMSRELLKHEEITKFTGQYQDYLRKDTPKPFWLVNTNKLVRFYNGADGLKTGYTSEAKFCLSATAKRDNLRVISVVMGEPDTKTRNAEVTRLFDYSFSQYTNLPIYKTGDAIGEMKVGKGEVPVVPLTAKHSYSLLLKKGEAADGIRHEVQLLPDLKAPVAAGQPIGKIVVYKGDQVINEFPLESPVEVKKAGWWTLTKRTAKKMFFLD